MLPPDSRQVLKGALCCLLSALLLQVAVGLQCYSYRGSFTNEISLGQVPVVTCGPAQNVCAEGVTALSLGDQRMVVVLKKGCHMGDFRDFTSKTYGLNLPSYSHARFCNTSLCNNLYQNNSHLPAFPTAPPPTNSSTSLLCYSCIGTTPESCSPDSAQQTRCYYDSPSCFNGTATATIGDFAVPIYLRSCQAGGCASLTISDSWMTLHIETSSCCGKPLCNREPGPAPTTTSTSTSAGPRPPPPTLLLLLLLGTLALGG
ncbi:ly6/PLAUR domain-containing protein 5-like isoform X1 [Pelodiscus sinensis]|uniref:ly6/PLAUR domain-containing protein 5-like isoform X1 n=1 Tax=Pelodiscus sinensis TaxID=13735 RepID=UPI003F6A6FE1